jgi:SagB-type dehydrogenase family enzyme
MEDISQLLWSAQGITDASGNRPAPSAGATYPLELYLVNEDGVFRYIPQDHILHRVRDGDLRRDLYDASLEQEFILEAPATIVFTAVFARTEQRYGSARSPRYIHMEVGHAAQNVLLQAVALGLGAVPVGAYEDAHVSRVLDLPAEHIPLYLIPVGHPR